MRGGRQKWSFIEYRRKLLRGGGGEGPTLISSQHYTCFILFDHHRFQAGGRTQNVSYMFQGVFEGGLENVIVI